MLSGEDGEVLSDIEVILPNEIIETCRSLRPNGLSYFMSVNEESQTTSQLSVHKLTDDSIRIRIRVMVLGTRVGQGNVDSNYKQLGEATPNNTPQLIVHAESEPKIGVVDAVGGRGRMFENRNEKNLKRNLRPGFGNPVHTNRLNKRLTSIWGSKRKKVFKKYRLWGAKTSLPCSIVMPDDLSLSIGDQGSTGLHVQKEFQDSAFNCEPGSSTVIILKTVVRQRSNETGASEESRTSASVGATSHSPPEVVKQSGQREGSPDKESSNPPQATSRDIAERLKARARKGVLQVSCELCGDAMDGYSELYYHVKNHHNDCTFVRNYLEEIEPLACTPCPVCKKLFATEASLTAHIGSSHPEESKKPTEQLSKLGIQRHHIAGMRAAEKFREPSPHEENSDDEVGPFTCKVCGRRCDSLSKYRRHNLTHGAFKFSCKHCDKRFRLKENLVKHIRRIHEKMADQAEHALHVKASSSAFHGKTSLTPKGSSFKCDHCAATFNRMSLLVTHMRYCLKSTVLMGKK